MKKILFVPSLNLGVIWWRVEMYAQEFVKKKDECAVHVEYFIDPSHNAAWDKLCIGHGQISEEIQTKMLSAFNFYDVMIFQKIQNKEALVILDGYKKTHPRVRQIMEIDDSIGDLAPAHDHRFSLAHSIAAEHAARADAIVCSTKFLAESVKPYIEKDTKVHIAPNCINDDEWKIERKERPKREGIRIGYVGGSAHDEDIYICYKALLKFLDKNKDATFVMRYGGYRPEYLEEHPQIDFKQIAWHPSTYPQNIYDLDIDVALAPLRDVNFNRCKSAIKWLEWASIDVPVIASNMESYKDIEGIVLTGNTSEEWYAALNFAVDTIRKEGYIFEDLQKRAKEQFNISKEVDKYLEFIDSF